MTDERKGAWKDATREELLKDAPVGLYIVSDEERGLVRSQYDVERDVFREAPTSVYVRVEPVDSDVRRFRGADEVVTREDGCVVVFHRDFDDRTETPVPPEES
jgi:hypothetical protein